MSIPGWSHAAVLMAVLRDQAARLTRQAHDLALTLEPLAPDVLLAATAGTCRESCLPCGWTLAGRRMGMSRYYRDMTMIIGGRVPFPERRADDLALAAELFHSLSDPARLSILQHLRLGEHRVRDLVAHLDLAQSTVSGHLACLKDCGLVTSRPHGRASMFSLTTEPELLAVLAAAERLLEATGYAVELCPIYGTALA